MRGRFRYTKKERIRRPQEFRTVMKRGRRIQSKHFVFFLQKNGLGFHRLGMVVKKEIGPATYRNRIKRYFREFFRLHKSQWRGSFDIVILAKKGYTFERYKEAEEELKGFFLL